jgi:hypothetical protein
VILPCPGETDVERIAPPEEEAEEGRETEVMEDMEVEVGIFLCCFLR